MPDSLQRDSSKELQKVVNSLLAVPVVFFVKLFSLSLSFQTAAHLPTFFGPFPYR